MSFFLSVEASYERAYGCSSDESSYGSSSSDVLHDDSDDMDGFIVPDDYVEFDDEMPAVVEPVVIDLVSSSEESSSDSVHLYD